jgi:hypothetical protein
MFKGIIVVDVDGGGGIEQQSVLFLEHYQWEHHTDQFVIITF